MAALAEKIPDQVIRLGWDPIGKFLSRESHGLQVKWEFSIRRGWPEVSARGEDAEVFLNLLADKFGTLPVHFSKLEKWDVVKGAIVGAGRVGFGVYVDLGILEPVAKDGLYPLHRMRAQLADGVSKSSREILEENALWDNFPLRVQVTDIEGERISLELADETRDLLQSWKKLPFDRVVATGTVREEIEEAVRSAQLRYDVIRVESLSLFSHCLVCKMGTDAPGIIAKIGRSLRGVNLSAYKAGVR